MKSQGLFEEAAKYLVGGVNSPVRAMKPYPFFTKRAEGSRLYDEDGKTYIDYCLGYGPLILGHAYPAVVNAVKEQMEKGSIYGTPTEIEIKLAKKICKAVPSAEMVRFVNTGTEATMGAIRLARGYTGKNKIVKVEGAFHGAHDSMLVKAGSGATTHRMPTSAGVPADAVKNTILLPFNDEDAAGEALSAKDIACIILEPVMGNAGCIKPSPGYLEFLRETTEENNILLVFDEIITGFRLSFGGAQEYYNVTPDITTFGKILGGGLPVGAITASREIMENLSPLGKVYQAGTFNGNPLSLTAGHAVLKELEKAEVYRKLEMAGKKIMEGITEICENKLDAQVQGVGSMFQVYFASNEITDYETALNADAELFLKFQREMVERGVFLPPSQYECNFISYAHSSDDIDLTLQKAEEAMRAVS